MKKIVNIIIFIAIISILFSLAVSANNDRHNYTLKGRVTAVNNDLVTVEDWRGFIWQFSGDSYRRGDSVALRMYDNLTDTILDDQVKSVTKLGTI